MNENLNLTETLKDAKGIKLYSSLCGDCTFIGIDNSSPLCIVLMDCHDRNWRIYPNGRVTEEGECVVFPSKENHDWSTFKIPKTTHKHFESFQKVLVRKYQNGKFMWVPELYSYYDDSIGVHYLVGDWTVTSDDEIIPYDGNEDIDRVAE